MYDVIDLLLNVWPFVLFKRLIQLYESIRYTSNIINGKSNHIKINDNYINFLSKMSGQMLSKKSTARYILEWREYWIFVTI